MHLILPISSQNNQLESLSQQLNVPVQDNQLNFRMALGQGHIHHIALPGNLHVYRYETTVHQPVTLETINDTDSDTYCLFVNLSAEELEKQIENKVVAVAPQSPYGIFYYGPGVRIQQQIPLHRTITALVITFRPGSFDDMLPADVAIQVFPPKGGFVFLDIDRQINRLLDTLSRPPQADPFTPFQKYAPTLALITHVFELMRQRSLQPSARGLRPADVERLFQARALLIEDLRQTITVGQLARHIGFSEAKLRTHFPRLFGNSIYQYLQQTRVERACDLLQSRRYSVSEVGFLVGYSSLSHFTKAFRKHTGVMPSHWMETRENSKMD
ncbi:helix-turn-helix domain-containing protein [Larkinella sp. VNQ87]|uniref:helix-turn-helix domain-containing protein n=1 Tax=Larkinella sp. VNQ87 TaxID=3400921 RepID=UPI003BFF73DD